MPAPSSIVSAPSPASAAAKATTTKGASSASAEGTASAAAKRVASAGRWAAKRPAAAVNGTASFARTRVGKSSGRGGALMRGSRVKMRAGRRRARLATTPAEAPYAARVCRRSGCLAGYAPVEDASGPGRIESPCAARCYTAPLKRSPASSGPCAGRRDRSLKRGQSSCSGSSCPPGSSSLRVLFERRPQAACASRDLWR